MDALEQTRQQLDQFITKVTRDLDAQNASLREYEAFFQKVEGVLPTFSEFVAQMYEGLKHVPMPAEGDQAPRVIEVVKEVEVIKVVEKPIEKIVERIVEKIVEVPIYPDAATLPVRERSNARALRTASPKAKTKTVKHILVVDDAEINRVLMGHYFKALPVKLEFSNSGADAIEKCQSKKFDLILMDLQMNEMGGIEAARKIRGFEAQTPIFAMTNVEPSPDEEAQAKEAGCNRYFSKGITKESLQDQVSETLFGELLLSS